MTTDELVDVLGKRSLRIRVRPDGTPELVGKREMATPALLRAIKFHRDELVRRFATAFKNSPEPIPEPEPPVPEEIVVENTAPRWVPHPGMKQESLDYWKAVMAQPLPPAWMMTVPDEPVKDDADENA